MSERPPPLPLEYLDQIKTIERHAHQCAKEDLMNQSSAIRDIRSLTTAMFDVYWHYGTSFGFGGDEEQTARAISKEIAACLAGVFRLSCTEELVTREVKDAVDQWVRVRCIAWGRSPKQQPPPVQDDESDGLSETAVAHMVALGSKMGIKKLCEEVGISPASYHVLKGGRGKEKVKTKMRLFLANNPISK